MSTTLWLETIGCPNAGWELIERSPWKMVQKYLQVLRVQGVIERAA
jgi:hypothetical protein